MCTTTDSFGLPGFLSEGHLDTNMASTRVDWEPSAVAPACQGSEPSICPCMRAGQPGFACSSPVERHLMSRSSVMQGVAGNPVPAAAMADTLQARDMFLNFGHGSVSVVVLAAYGATQTFHRIELKSALLLQHTTVTLPTQERASSLQAPAQT